MLARLIRWLFRRSSKSPARSVDRPPGTAWVEGRAVLETHAPVTGDDVYRTIGIEYVDVQGVVTRRVVTISRIDVRSGGGTRIAAYCHLRGGYREFRVDRIVGFFDPETEEPLTAVRLSDGS